jgi:hypothetical protein
MIRVGYEEAKKKAELRVEFRCGEGVAAGGG